MKYTIQINCIEYIENKQRHFKCKWKIYKTEIQKKLYRIQRLVIQFNIRVQTLKACPEQ